MDLWFTLFVSLIALAAAVGVSLLLVAYLSVMPVSLGQGRPWLWAVGIVPVAIVAIPVVGLTLLAAFGGSGMQPLEAARWLAMPAFALHFLAVLAFVASHRAAYAKPGKQLLAGLGLMALAASGLYGLGPSFAERVVAQAKQKGAQEPSPGATPVAR